MSDPAVTDPLLRAYIRLRQVGSADGRDPFTKRGRATRLKADRLLLQCAHWAVVDWRLALRCVRKQLEQQGLSDDVAELAKREFERMASLPGVVDITVGDVSEFRLEITLTVEPGGAVRAAYKTPVKVVVFYDTRYAVEHGSYPVLVCLYNQDDSYAMTETLFYRMKDVIRSLTAKGLWLAVAQLVVPVVVEGAPHRLSKGWLRSQAGREYLKFLKQYVPPKMLREKAEYSQRLEAYVTWRVEQIAAFERNVAVYTNELPRLQQAVEDAERALAEFREPDYRRELEELFGLSGVEDVKATGYNEIIITVRRQISGLQFGIVKVILNITGQKIKLKYVDGPSDLRIALPWRFKNFDPGSSAEAIETWESLFLKDRVVDAARRIVDGLQSPLTPDELHRLEPKASKGANEPYDTLQQWGIYNVD
jgi:hypothetical protein